MNNQQNQNQAPINNNNSSSSNNSNQRGAMVPEARGALNNMKYEIANELGINLKQGYNGDLPSRQAGYIGGYMVNLMQPAERLCTYFQLPPIRFSRNGLRNQFEQKVEYSVRVGVEV
ncbi:MAG: alpha/beta-type small acid-soluble spore protein [Clostridia bacterium]|nr:alpha/beta-type small acid-soluble spore protein [Clostridia bacterium]